MPQVYLIYFSCIVQSAYCEIVIMTNSPSIPLCFFSPSVVEQCICNRIEADEMVSEWVAYSTTKNGLKLSMDTLEQFEHEVTGAFRNFPLVFLLSCRIQIFLILFSMQVLNKKNKSKQSFRKEESYMRTRDIHFLQDLYLSQRTYHSVCFGMSIHQTVMLMCYCP